MITAIKKMVTAITRRKKYFWVWLCLCLITATVYAATPEKTVFPNGLTLIYQKNTNNDIVVLDLFIKAGTFYESDREAGLSNFMQTLLLSGTKNRSQDKIALDIESIGATLGTDAGEDFVEVVGIVYRKNYEKFADIFFDVVCNPTFPQGELEKERENTLSAIKAKEDSIFTMAYDLLNESLYQDYPYHKPLLGYSHTIKAITKEDLAYAHQKFYQTQNMILVVVGNIPRPKVIHKLKKYFPDLYKHCDLIIPKTDPTESLPSDEMRQELTQKTKFKQAYFMSGFIVPPVSSTEYPVLKIVNNLLGGGMSARLFTNLREKEGLAYEVDSFYPSRKYWSKFVIYLGLDARNIDKAQKLIQQQLQELKTQPVSEQELTNAKNYIKGTFLLDHQTNRRHAWYLGWFELLQKGFEYDIIYTSDIDKVTVADIMQTANKYFNENWIVVKLVPDR